ncbi:MAG: L-histidine N(alpha)-methyltransferase [Bacillota bacterium]
MISKEGLFNIKHQVRENPVAVRTLTSEIIDGLLSEPKTLPSKLFYDKKGSELFDMICSLDEYYPTRTEMKIMEDNISEISTELGNGIILIELGSGSSKKTRLLFDNLKDIRAYVPIDISSEYLSDSAVKIKSEYPDLKVIPLCEDYTTELDLKLPADLKGRRVLYYPGSTIGNFTPEEAEKFFLKIARLTKENDGLLIGVDLKKDKQILQKAYNDSKGITARFNLNILNRLNKEFGGTFNLRFFRHKAVYNELQGRIEMYLISLTDQTVSVCNTQIPFMKNERILTELSYKYNINEFSALTGGSFRRRKVWTDIRNYFSVQYYSRI